MIEIPTGGYSYPLGPKFEKSPIPVGYMELEKAVEMLGQEMFSSEWTGEERGIFEMGHSGQEFRSKVELETDREFRDAVLMVQCELECELHGGDPKQRYQIRSNFAGGSMPIVDIGDLPPLSTEALKDIESRFADKLNRAKAVRERRENVEDRFLREMLWSGSLKAHFVALDGQIVEIERHIWGGAEGKNYFKYGWLSLSTHFGATSKRPILILESAVATALKPPPTPTPEDGADGVSSVVASTGSVEPQAKVRKLLSAGIKDKKVLDKMESLLRTDPDVRTVTAASYAVVDEAKGGGTEESKAKRLARKYTCAGRYDPRDPH